jgi:hypothetical protein
MSPVDILAVDYRQLRGGMQDPAGGRALYDEYHGSGDPPNAEIALASGATGEIAKARAGTLARVGGCPRWVRSAGTLRE